jgi:hypothetical protein
MPEGKLQAHPTVRNKQTHILNEFMVDVGGFVGRVIGISVARRAAAVLKAHDVTPRNPKTV